MNSIDMACMQFRQLLEEQISRASSIGSREAITKKEDITIGIISGDGIGPIIMDAAVAVMEKLLEKKLACNQIKIVKIEGLTIENRLKKGESVPKDVMKQVKQCDVLLKGPTTTPMGGSMESANVTLRRELDLYANVRPISIPQEGIDWVFFREKTEGEYVLGSRGVQVGDVAVDFKVTTEPGTRRIAKAAFAYAALNGKNRVSIVTKANIMKKTDGQFAEICHDVAKEYPHISVDDWYIDIMTANLINPAVRSQFQVFVLPNLYGDIITDEAAQIQGGVGTAGSANIGDRYAMFEAVHGSAPRMIEEGLGAYANPSSILKAEAMMLRHIQCIDEAERLEDAMDNCGVVVTGNPSGATCSDYLTAILDLI